MPSVVSHCSLQRLHVVVCTQPTCCGHAKDNTVSARADKSAKEKNLDEMDFKELLKVKTATEQKKKELADELAVRKHKHTQIHKTAEISFARMRRCRLDWIGRWCCASPAASGRCASALPRAPSSDE